ncbi:hypothetical protein BJX66DRAFT_149249 [Aspergillus keveii]|uniref:Uncharacterized protein n=1 Tax=Aspergillus keveii TaxID=714993 RepID=A0ABR4GPH1_9EURO
MHRSMTSSYNLRTVSIGSQGLEIARRSNVHSEPYMQVGAVCFLQWIVVRSCPASVVFLPFVVGVVAFAAPLSCFPSNVISSLF